MKIKDFQITHEHFSDIEGIHTLRISYRVEYKTRNYDKSIVCVRIHYVDDDENIRLVVNRSISHTWVYKSLDKVVGKVESM